MPVFRARLRLWTLTWLLCQVLSLSAFAPTDCCAVHRAASAATEDCDGQAAGTCPMHAATGEECPMHASGSGDGERRCAMRGLCNGPAVALSALLSVPGVLVASLRMPTDVVASGVVLDHPNTIATVVSHDPPPPRL